jgi:8-amino-7-oxononanoate synthase
MSTSPRSLAKWCQEGGFIVRAIVPPTVPSGTERVRVCLHAGNTVEEIDALVKRIGEWAIDQGQRNGGYAKL